MMMNLCKIDIDVDRCLSRESSKQNYDFKHKILCTLFYNRNVGKITHNNYLFFFFFQMPVRGVHVFIDTGKTTIYLV